MAASGSIPYVRLPRGYVICEVSLHPVRRSPAYFQGPSAHPQLGAQGLGGVSPDRTGFVLRGTSAHTATGQAQHRREQWEVFRSHKVPSNLDPSRADCRGTRRSLRVGRRTFVPVHDAEARQPNSIIPPWFWTFKSRPSWSAPGRSSADRQGLWLWLQLGPLPDSD